jgi:beta-glucanase (GH16 family)
MTCEGDTTMATLDLSRYQLVWQDEFNSLSVANTMTATANWYLQQPWGGGFSNADMVNNPERLSIVNKAGESALQISMIRNAAGGLESALISTEFPDGTSRVPQDGDVYIYVEIRAWLPDPHAGIWPAFWGIEAERWQESTTRDHVVELDILEHYGAAMPDRYTTAIHDWDWNGTTLAAHASTFTRKVPGDNVMNTGWHTYGVEITPEFIRFYFDGQSYYEVSMSAFGQMLDSELGWIINLAAGGGWPIDSRLGTPAVPANMFVDYFRVYEKYDTVSTPPPPPTGNVINGTEGDNSPLVGTAGNDTINGLGGRDAIYARAGNDVIVGGPGIDALFGEGGSDTFEFNFVSESVGRFRDVIRDFQQGADKIDLSAIDANPNVAGDQAFDFIGTATFTDRGQLRQSQVVSGGVTYTVIEGNTDGTAETNFQVSLRGTYTLTDADFIL